MNTITMESMQQGDRKSILAGKFAKLENMGSPGRPRRMKRFANDPEK